MIMYGVTLIDDIVVAADSVVKRGFDTPRVTIVGNPTRIIGKCDDFIEKNINKAFNLNAIPGEKLREIIENSDKLISRPPKNK